MVMNKNLQMNFLTSQNAKGQKVYYFTMPFRKLLGVNDSKVEEIEKFYLQHRKRCYFANGQMIANSNTLLFNSDSTNQIIENIFYVKALIDSRKVTNTKEFIKILNDGILTKHCCEVITNVSDANYGAPRKARSGKSSSTPYMGFNDKHYRELFRISAGVKLLIPLVTHFIVTNGIEDKMNFMFNCYRTLFDKVTTGDLFSKLQLYTINIINSSKKQNKVIHERLVLEGTSPATAAANIVMKIIVDIIHRADPGGDVVAFIYQIITCQAKLKTRSRFNAEYYIVGSPTEKSSIGRKIVAVYDEEVKLLHQVHSRQVVMDHLWKKYVSGSKDKKKYENMYLKAFGHHRDSEKFPTKVHDFLLVTMFSRTFSGSRGVANIGSKENLIRLCVIYRIMADQAGMPNLGKLILCDKRPDRNILIKIGEVREYFEANTNIQKILDTKFSFMDESQILYKNITEILSSQWTDPTDSMNEEKEFQVSIEDINNEIVKFIELL